MVSALGTDPKTHGILLNVVLLVGYEKGKECIRPCTLATQTDSSPIAL